MNGSGTSVKNIKHLSQNVRKKSFSEFDDKHTEKHNPHSIRGKLNDGLDSAVDSVI